MRCVLADVILRRDQMFGHSPERPVPLPHFNPVLVQQHYPEPIGGLASLDSMVLGGITDILTDMMLGARHVEIGWQTIDGQTGTIVHKLSRPSRDIRYYAGYFKRQGRPMMLALVLNMAGQRPVRWS